MLNSCLRKKYHKTTQPSDWLFFFLLFWLGSYPTWSKPKQHTNEWINECKHHQWIRRKNDLNPDPRSGGKGCAEPGSDQSSDPGQLPRCGWVYVFSSLSLCLPGPGLCCWLLLLLSERQMIDGDIINKNNAYCVLLGDGLCSSTDYE